MNFCATAVLMRNHRIYCIPLTFLSTYSLFLLPSALFICALQIYKLKTWRKKQIVEVFWIRLSGLRISSNKSSSRWVFPCCLKTAKAFAWPFANPNKSLAIALFLPTTLICWDDMRRRGKSSNKPQLTLMNQWPFTHTKYLRQKRRQKFLVRMEMVEYRKIEKQLKFQ